jgi:hypothetical protein
MASGLSIRKVGGEELPTGNWSRVRTQTHGTDPASSFGAHEDAELMPILRHENTSRDVMQNSMLTVARRFVITLAAVLGHRRGPCELIKLVMLACLNYHSL